MEERGAARDRRTSSERRASREWRVSRDWRGRASKYSGIGERAEISCCDQIIFI
jgi:hypothetical protein